MSLPGEDTDAVVAELRQLVAVIKPQLEPASIDDQVALLEEGLGLDSVALIELIGQVENRFSVQLDETDLRLSNFASLRTLARLVVTKVAAGSP